jgi:hypothetical protein
MLSATKVNNATKKPKPYKITDGQGLHLLVTPSGGKLWRFKYRFDGKYKGLAFGRYPDVSLAAARDARNEARKQIAAGIDPSQVKKALKAAGSAATESNFEVVAREWVQKNLSVSRSMPPVRSTY